MRFRDLPQGEALSTAMARFGCSTFSAVECEEQFQPFRRQVQEDIRTRRILLPLDSDQSFGFGRSRDVSVNRINQLLYCYLQDRGFRSSALASLTRRNRTKLQREVFLQ